MVRPGWERRFVSALCRSNLRLSVRNPALRRRLTPDYLAMCKRQGLSVGLLPGDTEAGRAAGHRRNRPRRAGVSLYEAWVDGAMAYRSVAVPGFPNLFMLMGPHSPIGNQSLVIIAEHQADYAMWWINQIRDGRVTAAAPTEVAT
jgi:cation diffusion facilitator CzcD-associated flavoprotein CzcO